MGYPYFRKPPNKYNMNPIFWGMNTPPNKQPIQFANWLQKLVVSSGARGNPILKFGNSRFFRSNVGRWEHDFRCFLGSRFPFTWLNWPSFLLEKNSSNPFLGGIMFLYYPPWEITYPPTKGSWEAAFPLPLVEYVRVTLWRPSKALGSCHWRRASKLHMLARYNQTMPKPWLPSLKLTSHLKMDGWKTTFLLGWPMFRCYVSLRECSSDVIFFNHLLFHPIWISAQLSNWEQKSPPSKIRNEKQLLR